MSLLERAIELAVHYHKGQQDKQGQPYILHPLHLMMQMQNEAEMITAVLHDTIEDTPLTLNDLREEGFPEAVLTALALLTHDKTVPYLTYIKQIKANPLARAVKQADLTHNMTLQRLPQLTEKDQMRLAKYHRAWQLLQE